MSKIPQILSEYPIEERLLRTPIPFVANSTQNMPIPRDKYIQMIQLDLEVYLYCETVGAEAAYYGILNLIRRIKLISNGSDIHFNVPFYFFYLKNYFDYV